MFLILPKFFFKADVFWNPHFSMPRKLKFSGSFKHRHDCTLRLRSSTLRCWHCSFTLPSNHCFVQTRNECSPTVQKAKEHVVHCKAYSYSKSRAKHFGSLLKQPSVISVLTISSLSPTPIRKMDGDLVWSTRKNCFCTLAIPPISLYSVTLHRLLRPLEDFRPSSARSFGKTNHVRTLLRFGSVNIKLSP